MPDLFTPVELGEPPTSSKRSWVRHRALLHAPGSDRLAVVLGLLLAVVVIYWPSSKALDGVWRGSAGHFYTDGYPLLIVSLWFIARDRVRLAEHPVHPVPIAWALLVMLGAAWVWSWCAVLQDAQLLLLPLLWLAAIAAVLGWRTARSLSVPVCLLYFAMPALGDVNGILQELSVRASGALIWLTGIPAYMHGNLIELPAGAIAIAGGCSGIEQFIVGLTFAMLYGELCRHPWQRRMTWLALMGALSLICNWVRIFVITVVAYESDMRASLVRHHLWLGSVLFLIVVVGFLWAAEAWNQAHPLQARAPRMSEPPTESRIRPLSAAVALICLAVLPLLAYGAGLLRSGSAADVSIDWPAAPAGWSGPRPLLASDWSPHFVSPSAESRLGYVDSSGRTVEMFVVAYRTQAEGAKLIGYGNELLGNAHRLQAQSERIVDSSNGRWRETVAGDVSGSRSVIWSAYWIGKRRFVRPRISQLWYGLETLSGAPVASLVALRARCEQGCVAARSLLDTAAKTILPTVRLTKRSQGDAAR